MQISSGELIGWPEFISSSTGWAGEFQQLNHPTRLFKYVGSPLVGLFSPNALQAEINLFPNPALEFIELQLKVQTASDVLVLMHDATGNLVRQYTEKNLTDLNKVFEIKDLAPGEYSLQVSTAEGSISRKFTKTK